MEARKAQSCDFALEHGPLNVPLLTGARASGLRHPTKFLSLSAYLDSHIFTHCEPDTFVKMSTEEEQYDDGSMGAPGAPTPVSALEVRVTTHSSCRNLT